MAAFLDYSESRSQSETPKMDAIKHAFGFIKR